ncbi:MAG: dihydrofolate reductase family protein [Candidatus Altiarchaeota archaeon]
MEPYVILNSAISLDGKIGGKAKQMVFSNRLDTYRVKQLRGSVDAVMVGIETIKADNPEILVKTSEGKEPVKVIIDPKAEIPLDANILKEDAPIIVVTSKSAIGNRVERIKNAGKNVEVMQIGRDAVNLREMLWRLYEMRIRKVLLEGGRSLARKMLNEGFVNEMFLTVAPRLIGDGIGFFQGDVDKDIDLKLEGILQYGDLVVLHYTVK